LGDVGFSYIIYNRTLNSVCQLTQMLPKPRRRLCMNKQKHFK